MKIWVYIVLFGAAAVSHASNEDLTALYVNQPNDYTTADFQLSDAETPPSDGKDWREIQLPHLWGRANLEGRQGWYRFKLPDEPFAEPYGIYLWRFSMNAAVWLNDEFIGDGGRFEEPVARNWNRPFLFLLPKSAWRSENNYVYVRLKTYPSWGNLPPPVIGPYAELRPDYENRFNWQITYSQATFYISLITAIVGFSLWLADRKSTLYAWFALSSLAWTMYSLNLYVQNIPVSAKVWWWAVHSSVDWYGVTLVLFGNRLMRLRQPVFERALLMFGTLATFVYGVVPLGTLAAINNYFHFFTLGLVMYLFCVAVSKSVASRQIQVIAFAVCTAIVAGFGLHDFSMNTMLVATLWQNQFFWLQFSAPILMVTMLTILAYQFVQSFKRQVNAESQMRLERERIFADIHDDVGSRVLSLVYSAGNDSQAEMAREALKEIRAIVAGGTRNGGPIKEILGPMEAEARQRCEAAGIEIQWTDNVGTNQLLISDVFHYHLQRIVRELISNSIKHAGTRRIEVLVDQMASQLKIVIRDFGMGFEIPVPGTGMAGVSRRTTELGGTVEWMPACPGCRVELDLPAEQVKG